MAIKITCPNCKRGMLVPENMAGKKGRCKACQHVLTVPNLATPNSTAAEAVKPNTSVPAKPKAAPPPRASSDVEAEAAALFADEPKPAGPVEVKLIDLNCPFCDEAIHFPIDLAGKRAPCPECKHIIKVPELVKKDPKDWRKAEAKGPTGARPTDQPEPEGAWGSTTARTVGAKTLEEAGVIPKTQTPRTLGQKLRLPILGVSLVLLVGVGSWMGYRWWSQRAADRAVEEALAFASTPEAPPLVQAALPIGAGEYYLHSRKSYKNPSGKEASIQFGKAFSKLRSAAKGDERDALLTDLALALIDLGGEKEDTDKELRLPWDEIQKRLVAILGEISDKEARRQALHAVAHRLLERGQSARVLPLTKQVYPRTDAEKTADQAVALAVVRLVFLKVKDQSSAEQAAKEALDPYEKKSKPPLRAEVVALAHLLGKEAPPPGDKEREKAEEHIGKVEALARQQNWDKARQRAGEDEFGEVVQFRARLAVAAAAVEAQIPDTTDIEAAIKLAEGDLSNKAELSWSLYRLTQLALATPLPQDRVQAQADKIGNSAVRGRAQLAIFRARLAQTKQPVEDSAADKIDANSFARALAAQEMARHNTRLGANYAAAVQGWPQPQRAFGSLGVALGLQDREK